MLVTHGWVWVLLLLLFSPNQFPGHALERQSNIHIWMS
jgi:hypothetical protein